MKTLLVVLCCVVLCFNTAAQRIANYISNGSFEEHYSCSSNNYNSLLEVKNWLSIDSVCNGGVWLSVCKNTVPKWNYVYQYPHSGKSYALTLLYNYELPNYRGYQKNRLKTVLQSGKTYCVKFYVNIANSSTHGIDGFGAYFGSSEIDTITYCNTVLDYIIPQVKNPQGNIITDTLNWIAITGTFTANGTEKYLLFGNFLSDDDTDTLMINPTHLPTIFTEINIDDVSCIPIDLEAYAGRDTTILYGDSVYIGREVDFAIDSGCVWYKLPDTANAIDTTSGLWIKPPIGTHTYVVRQELECNGLKWDTVVVNVGYVGIGEFEVESLELKVYPNPANGMLNVESKILNGEVEMKIIDVLGKAIMNEKLKMKNGKTEIDVSGLPNGVYMIFFVDEKTRSVTKKLIINK
ncbi:MAG: T9SS type A sorting domain-containing protein [Bacteroidetes bacterium]|nr:T9SS type A sorting domain-containing protein [Bacteroidota bacterium]